MGKTYQSSSVESAFRLCPSCRKPMVIKQLPCHKGCKPGCEGTHQSWLCKACGRWWIFPSVPAAIAFGKARSRAKL